MAYKKYSDALVSEALVLLAVNKYDYEKTSETLGVSDRTLRRWDKDAIKKGIPELLGRAIERMLMHIPTNWKGNDWAIALGILMDKWLLLQGEPTSRAESVFKTIEGMTNSERDAVIVEAERILAGAIGGGSTPSED